MEGNSKGNIPLPLPDQEKKAKRKKKKWELTRTNSESSSGLTADCCGYEDFSFHNENDARPGTSTMWTNEKHNLYLNSLEASFVDNQLHPSHLRGCSQEMGWGSYSSQGLPSVTSLDYSHQLMVPQDGRWQSFCLSRNGPLFQSTNDSHFMEQSPSICHCASAGHTALCGKGSHVRENTSISCEYATSSEQHPAHCLCHQNPLEVSDQNFWDEDQGEKPSCVRMRKG